jgi:hypothetical protein
MRYQLRFPYDLLATQVVGEGSVQLGGQLGVGADEVVVDADHVRHQAGAAAGAGVEAEQPDQVGAVGVERERHAADLVAPRRAVGVGAPLVGDVAEEVTLGVLRPRIAEVGPDPPVDGGGPHLAVALDRDAANEDHAPAVDQVLVHAGELGAERGEREVLPRDVEHVVGARLGLGQGGVELGEVLVGQVEDIAIAQVVVAPLAVLLQRPQGGGVDGRRRFGRGHRVPPGVATVGAVTVDGACCGPRTRRPGRASVGRPAS